MTDIDELDARLLVSLQRDARLPVAELAALAGISTASVQRRVRRLRERGVIDREVAVVEPAAVGFGVTAIISVELERDRRDLIDGFRRRARGDDQVQHCYCVAGDADFVLIVLARDLPDYEAFTERFFLGDATVRRFRSSIVVSRVKADTFVPVGCGQRGRDTE